MKRFPIVAAVWAVLLVAGFAVVLVWGHPTASAADELAAAMHPVTPVTQEAAQSSATTIVRLQYPAFANTTKKVTKATDFGVEHWVITYTDTSKGSPTGVRISITVEKGKVEVTTFP